MEEGCIMKICPNCRAENNDDNFLCNICGNSLPLTIEDDIPSNEIENNEPSELISEKQDDNSISDNENYNSTASSIKEKILANKILLVIAAIIIIIVAIFVIQHSINDSTYKKALEFYNNQQYEEALELFEKVKDYSESSYYIEMIDEIDKKYNNAVESFHNGDYLYAKPIFIELGEYKKSKECLLEIEKQEEKQRQKQEIDRLHWNLRRLSDKSVEIFDNYQDKLKEAGQTFLDDFTSELLDFDAPYTGESPSINKMVDSVTSHAVNHDIEQKNIIDEINEYCTSKYSENCVTILTDLINSYINRINETASAQIHDSYDEVMTFDEFSATIFSPKYTSFLEAIKQMYIANGFSEIPTYEELEEQFN